MFKSLNSKEILLTVLLVVLSILLLNPFHFWMPTMMVIGMLACTVLVLALIVAFVVREQDLDERDATHRMTAGRIAFVTGTAFATLGIVYQSLAHEVDIWLVMTLVGMVGAKLATRLYLERD
jgi:hypothetical protein